jgi:hypothetical protein
MAEHPYRSREVTEFQLKEKHRYNSISDKLQARFEESMDNPRHFEKVAWFARYWNDLATKNTNYRRILGVALDTAQLS